MSAVKSQSMGPVSQPRARRRPVFLPAIELNRVSDVPLYHQVSSQLAAAVRRDGRAGDRLPSTRLLARMLGVSRNTVVTAYETLVASGLVEGRPCSRMVVAARPSPVPPVLGFDPQRVMRDAMYPAQTLAFTDPDGASLYLVY